MAKPFNIITFIYRAPFCTYSHKNSKTPFIISIHLNCYYDCKKRERAEKQKLRQRIEEAWGRDKQTNRKKYLYYLSRVSNLGWSFCHSYSSISGLVFVCLFDFRLSGWTWSFAPKNRNINITHSLAYLYFDTFELVKHKVVRITCTRASKRIQDDFLRYLSSYEVFFFIFCWLSLVCCIYVNGFFFVLTIWRARTLLVSTRRK